MALLYRLHDVLCPCGENLWKLGQVAKDQAEFRCFYCGETTFIGKEDK